MYLKKLILSTVAYLFFGNMAFAQSLSSAELINNAKKYDGNNVVYSGEVVGDVMKRGENAWVKNSLIQGLVFKGSYKSRGDMTEVHGIFHSSCPEHGGDLDIHADKFFVVSGGRNNAEPISIKRRNISLVLIFFAFILWLVLQKV